MSSEDGTPFDNECEDSLPADGISRKRFLVGGAAAGAAIGLGSPGAAVADSGRARSASHGASPPGTAGANEEIVLHNGKIHTMDDADRIVSAVAIRDGRFVEVGNRVARGGNAINLKGRTVIPGLIESCDHIVSFGNYRPGYHTVLENATSIAEVQATLAERRRQVPQGEWITSLGTWYPETMWAERRFPTRAELDAAVSDRRSS